MTDYELLNKIIEYGISRGDRGAEADDRSAHILLEIMHELQARKHKESLIGIVKKGTEAQQVMSDYGIESTEELKKALAFWNDQDSDRLKRLTERDEPKKLNREGGCPTCGVVLHRCYTYCPYCGQRLDWSCEEEKENGKQD